MFARKDEKQLRAKLEGINASVEAGDITEEVAVGQKVEVVLALQQLGEKLTAEEGALLRKHGSGKLDSFVTATAGVGSKATSNVLDLAQTNIKSAH